MSRFDGVTRCETCQHWGQNTGWTDAVLPTWSIHNQLPDDIKADYEQHNRDSGICWKVEEGWMWQGPPQQLPVATVWDGSEYKASLHTHKTFGCVLWEPRAAMLTDVDQ